MGVPSAAIVYTGESGQLPGSGKGAAYSEGIDNTIDIVNNYMKQSREYEKNKEEERKEKLDSWNKYLMDTPDVWALDYGSVVEKRDKFNEWVLQKRGEGYDVNNLPPDEFKEFTRLRDDVVKETNAAKANKLKITDIDETISEDQGKKYDPDYAGEWRSKVMDPKLSASERNKLIMDGSPYLKNADITAIVGDLSDEMEKATTVDGGSKITKKDAASFKKLAEIYLDSDAGQEDEKALMRRGKYNTRDELVTAMTTIFEALNPVSSVPINKPKDKTVKPTTTRAKEKTSNITYTKVDDSTWDQSLVKNKILLQEKPPVYVVDENGNKVKNFVPAEGFYIKKGGAVTAKGYGIDENGNQIEVDVDYNTNKDAFTTEGYPNMFDEFRNAQNETSASSAAQTPEEKAKKFLEEIINKK